MLFELGSFLGAGNEARIDDEDDDVIEHDDDIDNDDEKNDYDVGKKTSKERTMMI